MQGSSVIHYIKNIPNQVGGAGLIPTPASLSGRAVYGVSLLSQLDMNGLASGYSTGILERLLRKIMIYDDNCQ